MKKFYVVGPVGVGKTTVLEVLQKKLGDSVNISFEYFQGNNLLPLSTCIENKLEKLSHYLLTKSEYDLIYSAFFANLESLLVLDEEKVIAELKTLKTQQGVKKGRKYLQNWLKADARCKKFFLISQQNQLWFLLSNSLRELVRDRAAQEKNVSSVIERPALETRYIFMGSIKKYLTTEGYQDLKKIFNTIQKQKRDFNKIIFLHGSWPLVKKRIIERGRTFELETLIQVHKIWKYYNALFNSKSFFPGKIEKVFLPEEDIEKTAERVAKIILSEY
jgi:deoxyadenosine/deoxycytidine kinase